MAKRFATTFCHKKNRWDFVKISLKFRWQAIQVNEILTKFQRNFNEKNNKNSGKTCCHKVCHKFCHKICIPTYLVLFWETFYLVRAFALLLPIHLESYSHPYLCCHPKHRRTKPVQELQVKRALSFFSIKYLRNETTYLFIVKLLKQNSWVCETSIVFDAAAFRPPSLLQFVGVFPKVFLSFQYELQAYGIT